MPSERPGSWKRAVVWLLLCWTASLAFAQPNTTHLDEYRAAVTQRRVSDRLPALERFVASGPGSLQTDALEMLVWYHFQAGDRDQAVSWANQLRESRPDDPIVAAVLVQSANPLEQNRKGGDPNNPLALRALSQIQQWRSPEGMPADDYQLMRNYVYGTLTTAAGCSFLRDKQYASAQQYLHAALAYLPDDTRLAYCLGLADLDSPKPNRSEGYWYLARAADLAQGTAAGEQISAYARQRYRKDGGSDRDWEGFLAAATQSGGELEPKTAAVARRPSQSPASNQPAATGGQQTAKLEPLPRPPAAPLVLRPAPAIAPGQPVSLGILIATDTAGKESRTAVVHGLDLLLQQLRSTDEAVIMSYSSELVFQQDVTENVHALEDSLANLKSQRGSALYDAVSFATGHLARIARSNNARVLLVISDGRNSGNHISPFQLSGELSARGVRIYCIGIHVEGPKARQRLIALAQRTGGEATFINSAQFSAATRQIASDIGLGSGR